MEQLILHLVGDYVTQSDWMANEKTKRSIPALAHAIVYSLPFFLIGSPLAVLVICALHFVIDRWRLARFVVFAKNVLFQPCGWYLLMSAEGRRKNDVSDVWYEMNAWSNCSVTGYPSERPAWLAVWLLIAADNTLHLATNYLALLWL